MSEKIKVRPLTDEDQELISSIFKGNNKLTHFGDVGYVLPSPFVDKVDDFRKIPLRPDDVWVATFPRSGTTWVQDMVWLLKNNLDYETAKKIPLAERFPFIEFPSFLNPDEAKMFSKDIGMHLPTLEEIAAAPSPRFFKTHLAFSVLPPKVLDTSKVVYVARDPRDVAVSYYHHNKLFKAYELVGDFKSYWNLFIKDLVMFAPVFPHIKEAWMLRNHPNVFFIFYEDLKKDLRGSLYRLAKFLGEEYNTDEIERLCEHLDIKNFKNNPSVNVSLATKQETLNADSEGFVRKGKVGGWRENFDEEMTKQAEEWIRANLADTDLRFPTDD